MTTATSATAAPFWTGHTSAGAIAFQVMEHYDGERTFAWLGRFRWLSKDYEIGRIGRLLWWSLKGVSRGRAPIWRTAITVTEPIGTALVRLALRKFVK